MGKEMKKCPRCLRGNRNLSSISRKDNKTKICSSCGLDEVMIELKNILEKNNG